MTDMAMVKHYRHMMYDKMICPKIRNLKTYKMFLLSMNIITLFSVSSTNCYGTKNVERPRYITPLRISIQSTIRCLYRTRDIIKNLTGRKRNFYIIFGHNEDNYLPVSMYAYIKDKEEVQQKRLY